MSVGLLSPHVIVRKALSALLGLTTNLSVVLDTDSILHEFEQVRNTGPDVLLLEIVDPARDLETVSKIRNLFPRAKVLLLADDPGDDFLFRAITAGASGCVSKQSEPGILARALEAVAEGEIWLSHHLASIVISRTIHRQNSQTESAEKLTQREWEVLALISGGHRNKEIAACLFVSESTIKSHLATIYRKLRVSSRLDAAMYYFQQSKQRPNQTPESLPHPM